MAEGEDLRSNIFVDLSTELPKHWRGLGRKLSVTDSELDTIDEDYHGDVIEKCYQTLLKWNQKFAAPSLDDLADALCKIGRRDLVELVTPKVSPRRVESQHPTRLEESKQKLNQQLRTKYLRLTKQVQPIPFIKDKRSIDTVFTEVGLNYKPVGDNDTWQKLDSHHDILTKTIEQSRIQIIEGDPGYGKSMLSLQLVHDWCTCDPRSPLNNVDILIHLNLRQLGGTTSIYSAIAKCLLPLDSSIKESDVEQLLQNESIRTLILFDAYDEYPDKDKEGNFVSQILEENLLQHVRVILTTRSSCIPDGCDGLTGRIKLTGFDRRAREEYVRKVVTGGDEEATQKILTQFNTNSILADICQVPLFSVIYAHSAHETKINIDFRSVTEFFGYMVCCFHDHAQNKAHMKATAEELVKLQGFKGTHDELDELAYRSLSAKNQQQTWDKDLLLKELGNEFYDRHVDIGILVEEEILNRNYPKQPNPYTAEVRFFHKLFSEWYAAHHLVKRLRSSQSSLPENLVELMDPSDLQHVYRFACGLDPLAAPRVLDLLKKKEDCARFAVLCALEQKDKAADVLDTVRDLVSRDVCIKGDDSRLLQRTTIQLVELACQHGIPITCLYLERCFAKFDVTNSCIVLESDFRLANMRTVRILHLQEWPEEHEITIGELLGLLQTCDGLEELRLVSRWSSLPPSIPSEMIPPAVEKRNIHVQYDRLNGRVYRLSLEHGQWKIHVQGACKSLSKSLIHMGRSSGHQEWCLQELKMATEAGVGISYLILDGTFNTVTDNGQSIILTSGSTIPVLHTLQELGIQYTDINLEMLVGILSYVKECPQMTELRFCVDQMPSVVDPGLIPPQLKQRELKVRWMSRGGMWDILDLETGQWK